MSGFGFCSGISFRVWVRVPVAKRSGFSPGFRVFGYPNPSLLQAEKSNPPADSLKECQEYRENLTSQLLKKYFSRQGADLKNYIENFEKNLLKKDEELGMPIHEDISKFVAKLMKRIPMIPDDTIKGEIFSKKLVKSKS